MNHNHNNNRPQQQYGGSPQRFNLIQGMSDQQQQQQQQQQQRLMMSMMMGSSSNNNGTTQQQQQQILGNRHDEYIYRLFNDTNTSPSHSPPMPTPPTSTGIIPNNTTGVQQITIQQPNPTTLIHHLQPQLLHTTSQQQAFIHHPTSSTLPQHQQIPPNLTQPIIHHPQPQPQPQQQQQQQRVFKIQRSLDDVNNSLITTTCTQDMINRLSNELAELEKQNQSLRNELNIYQDLSQLDYNDPEISDYGLIISDANGDILVMNETIMKLLKYTKQDTLRLNWKDLLFSSMENDWVKKSNGMVNHNEIYAIDNLILRRNPNVTSTTNAIMCRKAIKRVTYDYNNSQYTQPHHHHLQAQHHQIPQNGMRPLYSICRLYFE